MFREVMAIPSLYGINLSINGNIRHFKLIQNPVSVFGARAASSRRACHH